MQQYGEDMIYVPRNLGNYDSLYGQDDQSFFAQNFQIEMYIKSVNGFSGDGNFMSKFGLEIRDQVVFSVSERRFTEEVSAVTGVFRPGEGDIIYFPINKKCYQIKFTNKFEEFYQFGKIMSWEMTCELFEYSDEIFDTGIPEIDILQVKMSTNIFDYAVEDEFDNRLLDDQGNVIVIDQYSRKTITENDDSDEINTEGSQFIDFTEINPFAMEDLS